MLLEHIGSTRVVFFGGKGGVGKTTVANATAVALADTGKRVLLVSTDPAHNLGHLWDKKIGDRTVAVRDNLDLMEIDPEATTAAHLKTVGATMRKMMPERLHGEVKKHLELSAKSPGTHEAAMLERISILVEEARDYDHIIFDTAPSGHTSRLMELPELMTAWTEGLLERRAKSEKFSELVRGLEPKGKDKSVMASNDPVDKRNQELRSILLRRRRRFEGLRDVLQDPQQCVFFIVLTAERLPVLETAEFHAELTRSRVRVGGCVVNRRSPADAGDFLAGRRAIEEDALADLSRRLPDVPVIQLPLLAYEVGSPQAIADIAAHL